MKVDWAPDVGRFEGSCRGVVSYFSEVYKKGRKRDAHSPLNLTLLYVTVFYVCAAN